MKHAEKRWHSLRSTQSMPLPLKPGKQVQTYVPFRDDFYDILREELTGDPRLSGWNISIVFGIKYWG